MKHIRRISIALAVGAALLSLGSCEEEKGRYCSVCHVDDTEGEGSVVVTADFSGRSPEAEMPASYTLLYGKDVAAADAVRQTATSATTTLGATLQAGGYSIVAYNEPQGVSVGSNMTATVSTLGDGTLNPWPGYLFYSAQTFAAEDGKTVSVSLPMRQRVRRLNFKIGLDDGDESRIAGVQATLRGVASSVSLLSGALGDGNGDTLAPSFSLNAESALAASVRLLGVMTDRNQTLTIAVTLNTGLVATYETDLTEALTGFNDNANTPLTLSSTLSLPKEAGVAGGITNWEVVDNGDVDVQ